MEGVPPQQQQQQLTTAVSASAPSTQQQTATPEQPQPVLIDMTETTNLKRQIRDEEHHAQDTLPTSNEDTSANQQQSQLFKPKGNNEEQAEAPAKRRRISPLDGEQTPDRATAVGPDPSSTTVSVDASPSKSSDSPSRTSARHPLLSIPSAGEVQESRAPVDLPPLAPPNAPSKMSHLYRPGEVLPDLQPLLHQIVEIKIPAKHLSTRNKEIRTRQIWGTDVYTDDSDIVAVLMHSGFYTLRSTSPSKIAGISAFIRILPARKDYRASTRNQLRSRSWAPLYRNFSFEIIRIRILRSLDEFGGSHGKVPKSVSGSGNGRRGTTRLRFAPDLTIVYNSSNEACLMYCLALIGDRGMPSEAWTSTRLRNEVLYLEAKDNTRFELYCSQQSRIEDGKHFDTYTFSRVKQEVLDRSVVASSLLNPAPLPSSSSEALFSGVDWEEIVWGPHCVCVRGQRFMLNKLWFRPRRSSVEPEA